MNSLSAGLSAHDVSGIRSVVASLLGDTDNGAQALTWYVQGPHAYNPAKGLSSTTETATPITAFVGPVTAKDVPSIVGAKVGDTQVLVDIGSLTPKAGDRFVDASSVDWSVYLVTDSPLDSHHVCYARKVN